jgi:hypothetical protein
LDLLNFSSHLTISSAATRRLDKSIYPKITQDAIQLGQKQNAQSRNPISEHRYEK